jgi:hypothetical protein
LLLGETVGVIEIDVVKHVNVPLFADELNVTVGIVLFKVTLIETFAAQPLLAVTVALYVPGVLNTGLAPPDTGEGLQLYEEILFVEVNEEVTVVLVQVIVKLLAETDTVGIAESGVICTVA